MRDQKKQQRQPRRAVLTKTAADTPVTKADLYDLDVRLGERFTSLQNSITSVHDRMTAHDVSHNTAAGGQVVNDLNTVQQRGLTRFGSVLAFVVAAGTAIAVIVKSLIGGDAGWGP